MVARASSARSCRPRRDSAERLSGTRSSASRRSSRRAGRCSRRSTASNSSSSRRCSSVRRRGTVTFTSTRWSPRPKPWSTGMPLPFRTRTSPGCAPGSNSSSIGPSSVSTGTVAPSAACDDRQVDLREDVVPLADEARVGLHAHEHVDVAGASAERARVALAGDADALAVVDAGRDVDLELAPLERPARAVALCARMLDDLRRAPGTSGTPRADELAEHAARDLLQPAACRRSGGSATASCPARRRRRRSARRSRDLERHRRRRPARGVDELDRDLGPDIRAARRSAPPRRRRRGRRRRTPRTGR